MRPSEAAVTRRLIRNLRLVAEKSLREVALFCGTSDTTVMRACRAAGYDGYQDLKYHVLREFTNGAIKEPETHHDCYRADILASLRAVEATLDKAANLIRGARRVVLTGQGASYGVALVAMDILFTLGIQALPVQDEQMANFAFKVNEGTENIGARRLHTIMEKVLDEISFEAPDMKEKQVTIDADYVRKTLTDIVKDQDLSRYIL